MSSIPANGVPPLGAEAWLDRVLKLTPSSILNLMVVALIFYTFPKMQDAEDRRSAETVKALQTLGEHFGGKMDANTKIGQDTRDAVRDMSRDIRELGMRFGAQPMPLKPAKPVDGDGGK